MLSQKEFIHSGFEDSEILLKIFELRVGIDISIVWRAHGGVNNDLKNVFNI